MAISGQYVVTRFAHDSGSEAQRAYATRALAKAAALRSKRAHPTHHVTVDFMPDGGGPMCPIPELSNAALTAELASEPKP